MPDTISSWGDWKAPADRITSFRALGVYAKLLLVTTTPVVVSFLLNKILFANVHVYTCNEEPCISWLKKALCDDERIPPAGLIVAVYHMDPKRLPSMEPSLGMTPMANRPF